MRLVYITLRIILEVVSNLVSLRSVQLKIFDFESWTACNKRSFIRWGDGETTILLGGGTYFQKPSIKNVFLGCVFLLKARKMEKVALIFPSVAEMSGNVHYRSTLALLKVLHLFGWNNLYQCALQLRNSRNARLHVWNEFHSAATTKHVIINQNLCLTYKRLADAKLSNVQVTGVASKDPNLRVIMPTESLVLVAAGPLVKWKCGMDPDATIVDIGHGLERYLTDENTCSLKG